MKKTLGLKKSDLLTDSLDAFWGKGAAEQIPIPQVDSTPRDILQPTEDIYVPNPQIASTQDVYNTYEDRGKTIKQAVEQGGMATQDLVPDLGATNPILGTNSMTQQTPMPMGQPQQQKSMFDLGGLDAMISKQLSYERGSFGIIPAGKKPMSGPEKLAKERAEFKIGAMRKNYADELAYNRLVRQDMAQQSRAKAGVSQQLIRNYKEAANKQRMNSGLPVFESPWDIIAGGKRKVADFQKRPIYDKKGEISGYKDVRVGDKLERFGGVAGAYQDLKPVGRGAKSVTKKTASGISDLYEKGYKKLSNYNENRIMDDLNKAVDSGMKSNEATGNKYTVYPKKSTSYNEPSFGMGDDSYNDDTMSAINKGMAEMNDDSPTIKKKEVKDLRDV